ncbi:hypothetical protein BRARA_B00399 [Brassica rapa]|uniref:NAC domain-containing protein n=1 Tax=Brassica campestris TaxID=3711 RepID=A0A398A5X4_BRACM|nr:hypothetical protein BRARA_B00399 [Brassica rapa]
MGRGLTTDQVLPASEAVLTTATGRPMAPGFRFNPTDEELISYYLKRKVQRKPIALDPIGEVAVYKQEDPSGLRDQSKMKTTEREWFFFTTLEKYEHNGYAVRSTAKGNWRERGREKKIKRGGDGQVIGNRKRLVFFTNNQATNWVIHEYQLVDNDDHVQTDAYVLCRLFDSSGSINAPFSEQEWDDADNEKIQKASNSRSMDLFDLNELPREFEIGDDDSKAVDQDDNNNDACLLPCVLNTEAPLPFVRYRRKRQLDSDNSIQTTPKTTSGTTIPYVAALLERSEPEPVDTTMVVPTSSFTEELIKDLHKERQQIAVERERYKLEMTNAEMTIRDLVGKNDALRKEIEELKKKNSNKEQGS